MLAIDLARLDQIAADAGGGMTDAGASPSRETQPRTDYSLSSPAPSAPASSDPTAALRMIDYLRPSGSQVIPFSAIVPTLPVSGGVKTADRPYGSVTRAKIDELRPRVVTVVPDLLTGPSGQYAPGQVPVMRPPTRIQVWRGPLVYAKADELSQASEARTSSGSGVALLAIAGAAVWAFVL